MLLNKRNSLPGFEDSALLAFWPTPGDFLEDITGRGQDNKFLVNFCTGQQRIQSNARVIFMNLHVT